MLQVIVVSCAILFAAKRETPYQAWGGREIKLFQKAGILKLNSERGTQVQGETQESKTLLDRLWDNQFYLLLPQLSIITSTV